MITDIDRSIYLLFSPLRFNSKTRQSKQIHYFFLKRQSSVCQCLSLAHARKDAQKMLSVSKKSINSNLGKVLKHSSHRGELSWGLHGKIMRSRVNFYGLQTWLWKALLLATTDDRAQATCTKTRSQSWQAVSKFNQRDSDAWVTSMKKKRSEN